MVRIELLCFSDYKIGERIRVHFNCIYFLSCFFKFHLARQILILDRYLLKTGL